MRDLDAEQAFLIRALERWGAQIELIDARAGVHQVTMGSCSGLLVGLMAWGVPHPAAQIAERKDLTSRLLAAAGFAVPGGALCTVYDVFALELPGPWVLKPARGFGGRDISMGITGRDELEQSIEALSAANAWVESQVDGRALRVFVTRGGAYAALQRRPPRVEGDGVRSVASLLASAAFEGVLIDRSVLSRLARAGWGPESIPGPGVEVVLRPDCGLDAGGRTFDLTDDIDPDLVAECHRTLDVLPGVPYAAVDLIERANGPVFLGLDVAPSVRAHAMPQRGLPRDIASAMVEALLCSDTTALSLRPIAPMGEGDR